MKNYNLVREIIEMYEDEDIMNDFINEFEEGKDIKYEDYFNFCKQYINDISEIYIIKANWKNI